MRRFVIGLTLLTLAACDSNSDPDIETDAAAEGPASATIRTTTTLPGSDVDAVTTQPPTTPTSSPTPSSAPPPSTDASTTAPTTLAGPTTTPSPPQVGDPSVTTELVGTFDKPIDIAVRPGDDALWVVEQAGRVVRQSAAGQTVMFDITGDVSTRNEQGLLGLAFSPDGTLAYTNHTDPDGTTTITEFPIGPDGAFDQQSARLILTVAQPFPNHNAGDLAFGPDGMLYIPLGDGGSASDPGRRSSDPTTLLGSLLRIDPTPTASAQYTIPSDNPFADGDFDGLRGAPEVWAWGLRNPWKIAFDPVTDELWVPDVGQNQFEEINVVGPVDGTSAGRGADFGWSAFEGNDRFNTDVADRGDLVTSPVLVYDHGDGCSISGGAPYRGTAIDELSPAFVYSDYCTSVIWALDLDGGRNLTLVTGLNEVTAVRAGPDGELYVVQRTGDVLKLVPG